MYRNEFVCRYLATGHTSVGALGDSFYEYLVKQWVMSGGKDTKARDMYLEAMKGITQTLLKRSK